jgi:acetyltransferase-like isoleucine patch superfamily enzyme
VGNGCVISWDCQFLDEDFHWLEYEGKVERDKKIAIGDHVWIGCGVTVLKGARVPNGCVVAANSVVTKAFQEEKCILAVNPARIIKSDVAWGSYGESREP